MKTLNDYELTHVQKKIIKTVYRHPGITRSELAEIAGISEKSAIRYVADFLNNRMLVVTETRSSGVGRSSELLGISPSLFTVLAMDVGGNSIKIGIVDLAGNVIEKMVWRRDDLLAENPDDITGTLCKKLEYVLKKSGASPIGLGIGISGMVDHRDNVIYCCPNVPGMVNIDTAETFGKHLGLPVCLDTSARCLALAEQRYGGHKNADDMIYVSVGNSIGAGIIINGEIFRGADCKAGEIGHTRCAETDERCTCGSTGCLELYATLPMMIRDIRNKLDKKHIFSPLHTMLDADKSLTIDHITKAFNMHERFVTESMSDAGQKLGAALSYYVSAFNPSLVIFGGSMTEYFPYVIEETIREIMRTVLPAALMNIELKSSALDPIDAAIKGAAIQMQNMFFGM